MKQPLKLGFLVSGNGSSAEAIVSAVETGALVAQPVLMVSNRKDAVALTWARERGLDARHIATLPDPDAGDAALAAALTAANVDLVILSGYLRRLGPRTQSAFAGRIVNIHPGPLPQFGGEGMYGRRVHEAVLDAGLSETAIVIHLVDGDYDRGPELARRAVQVRTNDTAETLEDRVKAVEPEFFVETLQNLVSGALTLPDVAERRQFVVGEAAAGIAGPALGADGSKPMYGLIGKMLAKPGQRDTMVKLLLTGMAEMPGCRSYIVAADPTNVDAIWITEVWDSQADHQTSLKLPAVQATIAKARPIIAGFGERFETQPLGGLGL